MHFLDNYHSLICNLLIKSSSFQIDIIVWYVKELVPISFF